jgi:phenylacetate-CoA ligase
MLQLKRNQWRETQELESIQLKKLKLMLIHAYDHVPYYHKLFDAAKFKPKDFKDLEDLRRIPVTTKKDLQRNFPNTLTKGIDLSHQKMRFTSGSTGNPLNIVISPEEDIQICNVSYNYPFLECGLKSTDNLVSIATGSGGESIRQPRKYAKIIPYFVSETSIPTLTDGKKLMDVLQQINPDGISTYPSMLTLLCNYDVSELNPKLIFAAGETLTKHCRDAVKLAFNIEIFNIYGSEEFGRMAFECNKHSGLHMITDNNVIEFIDERGEHVDSGEEGEIIVTGLINRTSPLIRFAIGDVGIPIDDECSCGRKWPLIKSIIGRTDDYLILPSDKKISMWQFLRPFKNVLKSNPFCISQWQVVQEKKNSIVFKYVKGRKFDINVIHEIKNCIQREFSTLGEEVFLQMEAIENIPMERTGKRKSIISKIR